MDIETAYNDWSSTYDQDRNLTRDLDQQVTRAAFRNQRYNNTLELGCGTGKNTELLSNISKTVHALDFSEGMIQQARQKLVSENVRFTRTDLTRPWPAEDAGHDLIICNLVLEHIEDLSFIFSEAFRCLQKYGWFYVSELHPFRQYQGGKARFQRGESVTEVAAYMHHISQFLQAATSHQLKLESFNEHWHQDDEGKPPRLATFLFKKQ